jgi:hypothetical protein
MTLQLAVRETDWPSVFSLRIPDDLRENVGFQDRYAWSVSY